MSRPPARASSSITSGGARIRTLPYRPPRPTRTPRSRKARCVCTASFGVRLTLLHDLDPEEEAAAAHVADGCVLGELALQTRQGMGAKPGRSLHQPFLPQDVDRCAAGRGVERVREEGRAHDVRLPGRHRRRAAEYRGERETAADSLPHGHQIRDDLLVVRRPHATAAPEAALDLVEDEERAGPVAKPSQAAEEAVRRDHDASIPLNRLDEDAGGRLHSGSRVGERVLEQPEHDVPGIAAARPGAPVRIRVGDEVRVGGDAELLAVGVLAGVPHCSDRPPRIRPREGDHVAAPGRRPGKLDCRLVRHRPRDREQHAVERGRRDREEPLVELGPNLGRSSGRAVRHHSRLLADRRGHARVAIAHVRDGEARVEVEIGTALGIPDVGSLGPRPDERLRLPERAHSGALGGADPLAHALGRPGHCSTIVRLCSRANCWT